MGKRASRRSTSQTRALGDWGENLAVRYLTDAGMQVLDRNWRCARGELDIVAIDGADLVAVEVKTRRSENFGAPFEAVGRVKLSRLRRLLHLWAESDRSDGTSASRPRIDVVSILAVPGTMPRITHLRGVGA